MAEEEVKGIKTDRKELLELIKIGEGLTLEFKENLGSDIGREICAFANSKGGKIILGIKDDGKIIGINITNSLKSRIQNSARNIDPSISVETEDISNTLIIKMKCSLSPWTKVISFNIYFRIPVIHPTTKVVGFLLNSKIKINFKPFNTFVENVNHGRRMELQKAEKSGS